MSIFSLHSFKKLSSYIFLCFYILINVFTNKVFSQNNEALKTNEEENKSLNLDVVNNPGYKNDDYQYLIGPGDVLFIRVDGVKQMTGNIAIEPDGNIYFPEIGALYSEGLTIKEFQDLFQKELSKYIIDPKIYIRPEAYRPLKVFVHGEVARAGYYTLNGYQATKEELIIPLQDLYSPLTPSEFATDFANSARVKNDNVGLIFPTVYDAIRVSGGINDYSDISNIMVIRKVSRLQGGGKIAANINLLDLILYGDESQNIRLFDGDVIKVSRSEKDIKDQIRKVAKTTLSPKTMTIYTSGRLKLPGPKNMPSGYSLNQAIALAGGPKVLKGEIELLRFTKEGPIEKQIIKFNPANPINGKNNPILIDGDIIRVKETGLTASFEVINETTQPFIGIFSLLNLIKAIR